MTQQLTNKDVFMRPMNKKICRQARKDHICSRVSWIGAALIGVIALFASVTVNAQIGVSLAISINNAANLSSYSFPLITYSTNTHYICFSSSTCAWGFKGGSF
jgi:hypothetical protein